MDIKELKIDCGETILISSNDFELINSFKWRMNSGYARAYKYEKGKDVYIAMHRLITNAKKGEIVDHINRIKTDNRRENLRIVSSLINCLNRNKSKNKLSKYKGVTKNSNGWQVSVNGKYFGTYKSEIDAAIAYDKKVIEIFGNAASTNKELGLL